MYLKCFYNAHHIKKDAGKVKTADNYQFVGVFGVGNQNRKSREQADKQNHDRRQGADDDEHQADEQNHLLDDRKFAV